jgi:hypothetical protein
MIHRAELQDGARGPGERGSDGLPRPSIQFRIAAWRTFQRALDPLAPPKPLRQPRL